MTADAGWPSTPPPRRDQPSRAATIVALIRDSVAVVEPRANEVASHFYSTLFSLSPESRELFPASLQVQGSRLLRALVRVMQMVDRSDELVPLLRQLGRDHRKFGVTSRQYDAVGAALVAAMARYAGPAWTADVEQAWSDAYAVIAGTMLESARLDQGRAYWNATVVHHERLSWDLAVVRIRPDQPVPYRAGQYLSVQIPQRPRLWRYLSPANAPRPDGQLEFHIRGVDGGWVSRAIVGHCQPGDVWRIGPPMGRLGVDRSSGQPVVMAAGGTGLAPLRAILEELCRWGGNPRVHLFYGGRTRDDLYDLDALRAMAATNPWLSVVGVLESPLSWEDDVERGTLADVITSRGAWAGHDVLVSGSPGMVRATITRLLAAGTPEDRIRYDPFALE